MKTAKSKKESTNNIQGKYTPCLANNRALCWKQVTNTTSLRSNQRNGIFQAHHNLNCKSKYVIHLLERANCKIEYIGKAETQFNIRLNNHQKDVRKPVAIPLAIIFKTKPITLTHIRNSYWLGRYATLTSTKGYPVQRVSSSLFWLWRNQGSLVISVSLVLNPMFLDLKTILMFWNRIFSI